MRIIKAIKVKKSEGGFKTGSKFSINLLKENKFVESLSSENVWEIYRKTWKMRTRGKYIC